MYQDISIKLNPYLGCSKNLIEFFAIIGYEENILSENLSKNEKNLTLSIISMVKSNIFKSKVNFEIIKKQVYPETPNIIRITKLTKKPKETNVIFSSCFDSVNGQNKVFYSCYAIRFYEKYVDKNEDEYFVPKAFLIYSQYPYFTTFKNICESLLKLNNENNGIPIEIVIHCYVNYVPSPINNILVLKNSDLNIIIPKLTGYPYADFNLCNLFNIIKVKEFIKIYMLIFMEISLLFFSPDLEKLNMLLFILYILNYPLTDSLYFWHIKSISRYDLLTEGDSVFTYYKGVNTSFNSNIKIKNLDENLNFIIDLENKNQLIECIRKNNESDEMNLLLKYINDILNKKKVKSYFLSDCLLSLKRKLKNIKKEYDDQIESDSFFFINENIVKINRKIQEVFYDFILNILVMMKKEYEYDLSSLEIRRNDDIIKHLDLSDEERIFLKYCGYSVKHGTYFDNFVKDFKAIDELEVSLLFSDVYVNLKMKDKLKEISDDIHYFKIMDNFFALKPGKDVVNFITLKDEYKSIANEDKISKFKKEKKNQLISLDDEIICNFVFYKNNKGLFNSFQENEKKDIIIESNKKESIIITIHSFITKVLNREYFIRSSLIYVYSIVFPLFSFNKNILFLTCLLYYLEKVKYFQRYYLNLLLKSINKYYIINKESGTFPQLTINNIISYCDIIKGHLIQYSILPNEEMELFFKNLSKEAKDKDINENKIMKNNFVFQYENEENYVKEIKSDIVIKNNNVLIFSFNSEKMECDLLSYDMIFQQIYSFYDDFFTRVNFNIENLDIRMMIEIIINIIYYLLKHKELDLACFLLNELIILKRLRGKLNIYKENNNRKNINITYDDF